MYNKVGKFARRVFIAGVGCTAFGNTLENPETVGTTEGDLIAEAVAEAMDDCGIYGPEIQAFYKGQVLSDPTSDLVTPASPFGKWIGMNGKQSVSNDEGCATGYITLDLACTDIASGKHDIVLAVGVEMAQSKPIPDVSGAFRQPIGDTAMRIGPMIEDRAYTRWFGGRVGMDAYPSQYRKRYGLSAEEMDKTLNCLIANSRKNAAGNPRAIYKETMEATAKKAGYDDVEKFLKSVFNPKLSEYIRKYGMEARTEGAAAAIVVSEEIAEKLKEKGVKVIEVLCCTAATAEISTPNIEEVVTKEVLEEAYAITGLSGKDIDLLMTNDFRIPSQLLTMELAGYVPEGEGWKIICEGETTYDGKYPVNVNGGRCHFGHAYGASGLADIYEAVKQMRGESEGNQMAKLPETVLIRGFGGGQNATAAIFKA